MITANYFSDIISGIIKDITVGLETEEVMFEVINNPSLITSEDIKLLKQTNKDIIYKGKSYRYIKDKNLLDSVNLYDFGNTKQCYLWSKSLLGLSRSKNIINYKYLISSEIEGIDIFKISKYFIRLSRMIEKKGFNNRMFEFNNLRDKSKTCKLVIAPIGKNILLELNKV